MRVAEKYQGKPCKHGHAGLRYRSNSSCVECLEYKNKREYASIVRARPHNREAARQRQLERVAACRAFVRVERTQPCIDCGQRFPWYVTEFDHPTGRAAYEDTIAYLTSRGTLSKLKAEIAKCDLVCANCHKVRTHIRALAEGTRNG